MGVTGFVEELTDGGSVVDADFESEVGSQAGGLGNKSADKVESVGTAREG